MKMIRAVTIGVLLSCPGVVAHAQIGTIPLLDSLPAEGKCERFAGNSELKRLGEARMVTFTTSVPSRSITVGVDDLGRPAHVLVMARQPIPPSKSENETLFAKFDESGRVSFGNRLYGTLGTPARLSEDRRAGLLPTDTAKIAVLAKAVIGRCGS